MISRGYDRPPPGVAGSLPRPVQDHRHRVAVPVRDDDEEGLPMHAERSNTPDHAATARGRPTPGAPRGAQSGSVMARGNRVLTPTLPRCALALLPQHETTLAALIAHACDCPTDTAMAPP